MSVQGGYGSRDACPVPSFCQSLLPGSDGQLRRNNFRRIWLRSVEEAGLGDVHFHDLRHTGNTLAATGGATTRELMQRMGHSSVRAALIYQHLVNGRDHAIAAQVDEQIKKGRPAEPSGEGPEEASGT
ncbi:tyrosine-type recombinase/integrase [Streptomyces atratus]|uniref:tyrosine-type recombinase/integrase n=1 Tax=Streptomyces atratus TaxID=1893 RepID=UPI0033D444DA